MACTGIDNADGKGHPQAGFAVAVERRDDVGAVEDEERDAGGGSGGRGQSSLAAAGRAPQEDPPGGLDPVSGEDLRRLYRVLLSKAVWQTPGSGVCAPYVCHLYVCY